MISALVTIYNPEDIVASNVRTISNQVDRIFCVIIVLIQMLKCL